MTITINKLSPDEAIRTFESSVWSIGEYETAIRDAALSTDDMAQVTINDDASVRATKRRVNAAANGVGMTIRWAKNTPDGGLYFKVKSINLAR